MHAILLATVAVCIVAGRCRTNAVHTETILTTFTCTSFHGQADGAQGIFMCNNIIYKTLLCIPSIHVTRIGIVIVAVTVRVQSDSSCCRRCVHSGPGERRKSESAYYAHDAAPGPAKTTSIQYLGDWHWPACATGSRMAVVELNCNYCNFLGGAQNSISIL